MKRRILALMMLAALLLAAAAPTALAATPSVKKTSYKGSGYVEVDFKRDVQYKSVSIAVKDSSGKKYSAKIVDRDDDDLTFYVKSIKAGKKYKYTIKGIRSGKSGSYVSVSGSFSVPKATGKPSIRKVDYDADDRELDIDFSGRVEYKSAKVTVKDSSGKKYTAKIRSKDSDDMTVYVKGLKYGSTYKVTVSGVRLQGADSYTSVTKSFKAVDD